MKKLFALAFTFMIYSCSLSSSTYYMDSQSGDDTHTGNSPKQAWKTLKRLNQETFKPGTKILFKAGTSYDGQFEPKGSGSEKAPIIVDQYGEGEKPALHGHGEKQHTVLLEGIEYWEVNNLEITNKGDTLDPGRNGLIVYAWDMGDVNHIYLKNLTIHDVNGSCIKNEGAGSGIFWVNGSDITPTRFVDLRIEDCHIYRCQRNGITCQANFMRDVWFPSLDVVIRGNLIEEVPGDAIVPIGCDGALIEYNTVRNSPDLLRIEDAAAGIWPWSCDNTVIQYNEVSGQHAKWDGQAFDSDYNCRNTVIQYNFSHDNMGGFVMVCNEGNTLGEPYNIGTENTIIRHNISINDGIRPYQTRPGWFAPSIHISGPAKNTTIEGNILVVLKKATNEMDRSIVTMDNWGGPWPENTQFINNVFYVLNDSLPYRFSTGQSIQTTFKENAFYGNFTGTPYDTNPVKINKDFIDNFPFPVDYPAHLKARVIEKLQSTSSLSN